LRFLHNANNVVRGRMLLQGGGQRFLGCESTVLSKGKATAKTN
jgi:hypothetical protein